MTAGSSMAAMIFSLPPQCGQRSMSISKTRLSRRAQLIRAGADGPGAAARSAEGSDVFSAGRGTIAGRSLALGASTPWKRIKCKRGRGTRAASRLA